MKKFALSLAMSLVTLALPAGPTDVVCGPWISDVSPTSFTVNWISEGTTLSWVEVGLNDGRNFYSSAKQPYYQTYAGKRVTGTAHSIKVDGLQPGTSYVYRICGKSVADESSAYHTRYGIHKAHREKFLVKTLDPDASECRFAVVNDIHGREDLYSDLTKDIKPSEIDFLMVNGDVVSEVYDIQEVMAKCVDPVRDLVANVPYLYSRGNHEGRGYSFHRLGELFRERGEGWYYTFRQGPVAFIVLDAGEDKPDSDVEYAGLADYDPYRQKQLEWLKAAVKEESVASAPVKICLMHIPAYSNENSWYAQNWVNANFVPVLNEAGVNLMLSGHIHEHAFVEKGVSGLGFPVICNDNEERLMVSSDGSTITVESYSRDGKLTHTYTL